MNEIPFANHEPPAPSQQPPPSTRRPRLRMVAWLVLVPGTLLLLALAGANWRTFHLAYCRHLLRGPQRQDRQRGLRMLVGVHVREGMSREQVERLVRPLETQAKDPAELLVSDADEGKRWVLDMYFREGRLRSIGLRHLYTVPGPGKALLRGGGASTLFPGDEGRFHIPDSWPESNW